MKRKQNLNVSCFVNFIKMGTAARNVNDKYIDPVKFGTYFRQDEDQKLVTTRYTVIREKMPLYYIFLLEWLMGRGARGGGNQEIAQVKNMMPIFTSSGRGYYLQDKGGVLCLVQIGEGQVQLRSWVRIFMKRGKEAYELT